jgi:hypothetical protein
VVVDAEDGDEVFVRIQVQLSPDLLDAIDEERGDVPRSAFIRRLLRGWALRGYINQDPEDGGGRARVELPLGPRKQVPGERLKKGKGK